MSIKEKEKVEEVTPVVETPTKVETPVEIVASNGIEVGDPMVLRPVDLPLVVKPTSGSWENEEQAEFAKTLNGYAYKNPTKWAEKKDKLIAQLAEIGKNSSAIVKYRGNKGQLAFKNQLMQK